MNFPIQLGPPQFVLLLVGVIGLGLLIHSAMSITRGQREIFEDKDGNRFYGKRRRLRWKRGVSGILLLLIAVSLL